MGLKDLETGEPLILSHFTLRKFKPRYKWATVNTNTPKSLNKHLMDRSFKPHIIEDSKKTFYPIYSTVRFIDEESLEVRGGIPTSSDTLVGYFEKDYLEKNLPNCFKYFVEGVSKKKILSELEEKAKEEKIDDAETI